MIESELLVRMVRYVGSDFRDGDRLPSERDLALTFRVSRSQIRETLSKLEAYHLVTVRPKARAIVNKDVVSFEQLALFKEAGLPIDLREAHQAIEVRQITEVSAVRLACERAREENFEKLEAILASSEAKIASGEPIHLEDEEFHLEVICATQNDILVHMISQFYILTRERRRVYFTTPRRAVASHREHLELYEALKRRDADAAEAAMKAHLHEAATSWTKLVAGDAGGSAAPKTPARKL